MKVATMVALLVLMAGAALAELPTSALTTTEAATTSVMVTATTETTSPVVTPLPIPAIASADSGGLTRPPAFSSEFAELRRRSIFVKGRQAIEDPTNRGEIRAPLATQPASRQATLVFNGASDADNHFTAFIEDTTSGQMTKVQIGDTLAQGRVTNITLDQLDFESPTGVTHVLIGQNLQGVAIVSTAHAAASTAPAGETGGGDVLERMRRRRQQEMGTK